MFSRRFQLAIWLSMAFATTASGQFIDPSFEFGALGSLSPNWKSLSDAASSFDVVARTGARSLRLSAEDQLGALSGVSQSVAVSPGQQVDVKAWSRISSFGPLGPGDWSYLSLEFQNAAGLPTQPPITTPIVLNSTQPLDTWVAQALTGIAPPKSTQATLVVLMVQGDPTWLGLPPVANPVTSGFIYWDDVSAVISTPANPCDLTGDGAVDALDAGLMFANWGASGEGDCNYDGFVDAGDAGELFAAWTGDSMLSVPEPHTAWPALLGMAGLILSRPRATSGRTRRRPIISL